MSAITVKPVETRHELLEFIKLVWKINKNDPNWTPPLLIDRLKNMDKKKNPFFLNAEAQYFLAYRDNEIVGRVAAIVNHAHNQFHEDNIGFFGFLDAINDEGVFEALLNEVKSWLREKGKDSMIGPMNHSTNEEVGMLIDGFDTPPQILMTHNQPYYKDIMEKLGYQKIKDMMAYNITRDSVNISEKLKTVAQMTKKKMGVEIRPVKMSEFEQELIKIRHIYNNAWSKNWGFIPMTEADITNMAAEYKKVINPELLLIGEMHGKPIGFLLALPNYNEVLAKIKNGKLFPTGWLKFLLNRKKITSMRVITLGIVQDLQKTGIGGIFYLDIIQRGLAQGYYNAEMSWILEDNHLMRKGAEQIGGYVYKTYRIYGCDL